MDLVPEQTRARLAAVARVVLVGQRGSLADQLDPLHSHAAPAPRPPPSEPPVEAPAVDPASRELEFFNGLGGFAADGREYVILLGPGQSTRSEEHTSELQSQSNLVCRLLLEKIKST